MDVMLKNIADSWLSGMIYVGDGDDDDDFDNDV